MKWANDRIKVKHWHDWKLYCTFCGGGTNGHTSICEICGARWSRGVRTRTVQHEGLLGALETFYRDEVINDYKRGPR